MFAMFFTEASSKELFDEKARLEALVSDLKNDWLSAVYPELKSKNESDLKMYSEQLEALNSHLQATAFNS